MKTIEDVFEAFGGPAKVGQAIGVSTEHASAMKRRRSIPDIYRPALVAKARERRIAGITYESLTLLHAEQRAA